MTVEWLRSDVYASEEWLIKITSIRLPYRCDDLQPIEMSGLGEVVLIAGANGSGKTRLLKVVQRFGRAKLGPQSRYQVEQRLTGALADLARSKARLESAMQLEGDEPSKQAKLDSARSQIASNEALRDQSQLALDESEILTLDSNDIPNVVYYKPQSRSLRDWKSVPHEQLVQSASNMTTEFNIDIVRESGIPAVQQLINRFVYLSNENTRKQSGEDVAILAERIRGLTELLEAFLGTKLTWDEDGDPKLFGLPLSSKTLSEGQTVLLQIALSLFFQEGQQKQLIVLLDEPENHLHPHALLEVVDTIRRVCANAQVWISTHSISVLAHFDTADIWFAHEGFVERGGNKSLEVLHSLLGGELGIEELQTFLALPAKASLLRFAAQCLGAPAVADTNIGDPQTSQIAEIIKALATKGRPLRVLDFGAGSGRLLPELAASFDGSLAESLDYLAWDQEFAPRSVECKKRLLENYDDGARRHLVGVGSLRGINDGSIDVVVMCNTLHEIAPSNWLQFFGTVGTITKLLAPNGFLLLVEDQMLSVGERAHEFGYLVLDSLEIKKLFGALPEDADVISEGHPNPNYSDRLKAHLVPAWRVGNATADTRRAALIELKSSSLEHVQATQGKAEDARAGRRYAFWAHQHVNATLALESL